MEVLGNCKKSKIMPDYRQEVPKNEKTQVTQVVMESQKKQKQRGEMKGACSYCGLLEARKIL